MCKSNRAGNKGTTIHDLEKWGMHVTQQRQSLSLEHSWVGVGWSRAHQEPRRNLPSSYTVSCNISAPERLCFISSFSVNFFAALSVSFFALQAHR